MHCRCEGVQSWMGRGDGGDSCGFLVVLAAGPEGCRAAVDLLVTEHEQQCEHAPRWARLGSGASVALHLEDAVAVEDSLNNHFQQVGHLEPHQRIHEGNDNRHPPCIQGREVGVFVVVGFRAVKQKRSTAQHSTACPGARISTAAVHAATRSPAPCGQHSVPPPCRPDRETFTPTPPTCAVHCGRPPVWLHALRPVDPDEERGSDEGTNRQDKPCAASKGWRGQEGH